MYRAGKFEGSYLGAAVTGQPCRRPVAGNQEEVGSWSRGLDRGCGRGMCDICNQAPNSLNLFPLAVMLCVSALLEAFARVEGQVLPVWCRGSIRPCSRGLETGPHPARTALALPSHSTPAKVGYQEGGLSQVANRLVVAARAYRLSH